MAKYIVKRVAMGIFSVFIVATLTFFIMNLVPGGPFVAEKSISKAAQQALAEKYGLDKPLGAQYLNYMNSLIHGDMGLSLKQRGRTVNQIIFSKLPVSARTAGLAVLVALCVGIPLGCISAYNRGKWADNLIIVLATCGIAIPSFISSVVLLYTFGMNLKILPTVGLNEPAAYIMPVTALAIYPTAYITRLMRSSLVGCYGPGLHAHRPRQGCVPASRSCSSMRCATPSCLSSPIVGPHAGRFDDRLPDRCGKDLLRSRAWAASFVSLPSPTVTTP